MSSMARMRKISIVFAGLLLLLAVIVYQKGLEESALITVNALIKLSDTQHSHQNIQFGPEPRQSLDVYPNPDDSQAPVLIFIHGGGWRWGNSSMYYFVADAFLDKGYTVVLPNYIKYPEGGKFPQFIEDAALAIAWVKNNIAKYNGDANSIFLSGHSAGAHTAALLVTDPSYLNALSMQPKDIKGFAGIAGPYNFTPTWPAYVSMFGEENFDLIKASNHVNGDEPPILLLHAKGDSAVEQFNYETLSRDLQAQDARFDRILYDNTINHGTILLKIHPWFADDVDIALDIDNFFRTL